MKVLLTGATGLVGAHTALELLRHGHQLRLLVRNPQAAQRYFARHGFELDDVVVGDMGDRALVAGALAGCDAVVHAAAVVDLNARRAQQTLAMNRAGLDNVVGQACQAGIERILYVSSIGAIFQPGAPRLDESAPLANARNAYSRSKELCEIQVREWQAAGRPIMTTYPSGVFGPHDPKLSQSNEGLIIMARDLLPLTSSGLQFVDVRDLAMAHRLLLERPSLAADRSQERYLVAGHFIPWPDFATLLEQASGCRPRRLPLPGALLRAVGLMADGLRYLLPLEFPISQESAMIVSQCPPADSSRLLQVTGMQFRPPQQTLADAVAWFRQQGHM
ncbi:MAG TPA: NAD-dependent epimerase/dehydratase family protein [Pseudomonadales bacterium]